MLGEIIAVAMFCFFCFAVGIIILALIKSGEKADENMKKHYEERLNQKKEQE